MSSLADSPPSGLPQDLQERMTKKFDLNGITVKQLDKTGSSLHLLSVGDRELVRNAGLSESVAATWEFAHSYVAELFPEALRRKLFGAWDKPQVAPILQRNGQDRIYHRDKSVSIYSEMVGFNTVQLAEAWQLDDLLLKYGQQSMGMREPRWLDSITYHLTNDIAKESPWFDPDQSMIGLMESYWQEFARLNRGEIIAGQFLTYKDLRRKDMDNDAAFHSSVQLIEFGHQICDFLRDTYKRLDSSGEDLRWWDKPAKELVLFLLHLQQTSVQQMVLWWLGISHGHLHAYNSVSRVPDDQQNAPSPLVTTIIDFDRSGVSAQKLSENDELYQSVNGVKVKELIRDESKNLELRLLSTLYLPLNDWDDSIFQFVRANTDRAVVGQIVELVSKRAAKDVVDSEKYTRFANLLYETEKKAVDKDTFPAFHLTVRVVMAKPELITSEYHDLAVLSRFYLSGIASIDPEATTSDQKNLLLSGISYLRSRNDQVLLEEDELRFAFRFALQNGSLSDHAESLVIQFVSSYSQTLLGELVTRSVSGDSKSRDFTKEFLRWLLSRKQGSVRYAAMTLIFSAIDQKYIINLLEVVDFTSLDKKTAQNIYLFIRERIGRSSELRRDESSKSLILETLDALAQPKLDAPFRIKQRIRKAFRREGED